MLWYFSLSELGKNCTPIFSPLPMPVLSMGNTGKASRSFYSVLCVLSMMLFAQ